MGTKTDSERTGSGVQERTGVQNDGNRGVQRMKPDAATARVVDRVGQQMIYINRQTRHHEQVTGQPGFSIENHGNDKRDQAVKSKVENCLASSKDSALNNLGG